MFCECKSAEVFVKRGVALEIVAMGSDKCCVRDGALVAALCTEPVLLHQDLELGGAPPRAPQTAEGGDCTSPAMSLKVFSASSNKCPHPADPAGSSFCSFPTAIMHSATRSIR